MLSRAASVGGPGPATMLFRALHLAGRAPMAAIHSSAVEGSKQVQAKPGHVKHAQVKEAQMKHAETQNSQAKKSQAKTSVNKTVRARLQEKERSSDGGDVKDRHGHGKQTSIRNRAAAPQSPPSPLAVAPDKGKRKPPAVDIAHDLDLLRRGIRTNDLSSVLQAWDNVTRLKATSRVSLEDYGEASGFVAQLLLRRQKLQLHQLYDHKRTSYDLLTSMAIEAGSRLKLTGLIEMSLELIRCGLPGQVPILYARLVGRARQIRGISSSSLVSSSRKERISGRIIGNTSFKVYSLVVMAAHTAMKTFNVVAMASLFAVPLFGTHEELRFRAQVVIARAVDPNNYTRFLKQLVENNAKLDLAISLHHPSGLVQRLHRHVTLDAGSSRDMAMKLYVSARDASTGPGRFLTPVREWDLWHDSEPTSVQVPLRVWAAFLLAFGRKGDSDQIMRMVEVDLPLLYNNNVPPVLLAYAMHALASSNRVCILSYDELEVLNHQIDTIWERIRKTSGALVDPYLDRMRIDALSAVYRNDEAKRAYRDAVIRLKHHQVAHVASHLDASYVRATAHPADFDNLMALLRTRISEPNKLEPLAISRMILHIVGSPLSLEQRRRAVAAVRKGQHPDVELLSWAWGGILSLLVESDMDISTAVGAVPAKVTDHHISWPYILSSFLDTSGRQPEARRFEVAIYILQHHVRVADDLSDVMQLAAFRRVAAGIFKSTDLSASQRHKLLQHIAALVPEDRPHLFTAFTAKLFTTCLMQPGDEKVSEARYWFDLCERNGSNYLVLVEGLLAAGETRLARVYAEQAPASAPRRLWDVVEPLGVWRPPWPQEMVTRRLPGQTVEKVVMSAMGEAELALEAVEEIEEAEGEVVMEGMMDEMELGEGEVPGEP